MVFKGTKNRSAEQIARSVDSIGGGLDAFTSKELVSYNVKVLDEHLPHAFDVSPIWCAILCSTTGDIEKEKGVILEELKMEVDNPEYLIHEIFSSNFWKGHALGRPILGTQADDSQLSTARKSSSYYRRFYSPTNILITAAGNLSHRKAGEAGGRHFAELKARMHCLRPTASRKPHAPLVFRKKSSLEQVHLYLGVPSISMPHK